MGANRISKHPPIDTTNAENIPESTSIGGSLVVRRAPLAFMDRNQAIVDESEFMIAAPLEFTEQKRGGTWATVRMTRKAGKPLTIVWRDGTVMRERWP